MEKSLAKTINWLRPTGPKSTVHYLMARAKLKADITRGHPISDDDAKAIWCGCIRHFWKITRALLKQISHVKAALPYVLNTAVSVHLVLGSAIRRDFGRGITPLSEYFSESQSNVSVVKVVDD